MRSTASGSSSNTSSATLPALSPLTEADGAARLQAAMQTVGALIEADLGDLSLAEARADALRRIAAAARTLLQADVAVFFGVPRNRTSRPPLLAATDYATDSVFLRDAVLAPPAEAALRKAFQERRLIGVDDLAASSSSAADALPLRSLMIAPLTPAPNRPAIGALALYMVEPRLWQSEDVTLLSLYATGAAAATGNLRLRMEQASRASEVRALYEIAHLLGSSMERDALLNAVISRLTTGIGAKLGAVMRVDRGDQGEAELKICATHGLSDEYLALANAPGGISLDPRHPHGSNPAAISVRELRPCVVADVLTDARFAPYRSRAAQAGYQSVFTVPLCAQEHVHGCLALFYEERRDFTQAELNFASAVADAMALALERMELSERLMEDAVAHRSVEVTDRLKAEFISTVSHELRTPLTIIKGYSDLLASGQAGPLSETQQNFLNGVQRNTTRLTELVTDLLDLSQIEAGQFGMARRQVDLGRVVIESCAEYERVAAQRGIQIKWYVEEALPPVEGDTRRLGQVVANLLSNAVKYSPSEAMVQVSCTRANQDSDSREEAVLVRVRDNGPGILPAAQAQLFEKFYRVDSSLTRQVGGTGLGLSIAKSIVEQHGGRIWVESSAPGEGSTFAFVLPSAIAGAAMPALAKGTQG